MKIVFFILFTLSILFSGEHAGSSFRYGTNAREIGLSNSLVASNNIGFNAFNNPAILAFNRHRYIGSSLFILSGDRNIQAFTYSQNLPPRAAAAISFFRAGAKGVGIDTNKSLTGDIGYSDGYIMLSFGIAFNKYLSIGINAKTLLQKFLIPGDIKYTSNGIGLDLGIFSSFNKKLNVGVKVESGKYNFREVMDGLNVQYEEIIPFRVLAGAAYSPLESILLLFQHELINLDSYKTHRSSIAMEYNINYHIPIFFRLGMKQNKWKESDPDKKIEFKPSFGIGCQLTLMNKLLTNLDYGVLIDELGMNNLISVSIEF